MDAFYERHQISSVMAGLVPAIHVFAAGKRKTWMPADISAFTRVFDALCPAMTTL
jgi:hypothetical protein